MQSVGAIHSAKISGTEWIGSVQPEKFRKKRSTFRGGPLFSVGPVRSKWTVPFDHSDPFSIPGPRYLPCTKWRKILITALLWNFNSRSIGVTRTSMYSYDRSVVASQAKCMFWLLTALKDDLFPKRIWNVPISSFDSNVVFEVIWQISGNGLLKITHYTG